MIGKSQDKSRSGKKKLSFRGCSQGQFKNCNPFPYSGRDVHHGCGSYLPHQTSGPTIAVAPPLQHPPPVRRCEICEVELKSSNPKFLEQHKNGKRHQRLLNLKLRGKLEGQKAIDGQEVLQHEKVQKSEKKKCLVENINSEATIIDNHKDCLQKNMGETSEVPAEEPEGELRDNFATQGRGFKRQPRVIGAGGGKYLKTDNGIRRSLDSSNANINALSNSVVSEVQVPAVTPPPPPGPVASKAMAPAPVVGSSLELQFQHDSASQMQVSEAKAHHETQNPTGTGETNYQPESISVEIHAPATSGIKTQTEDANSDSAAIVIAPLPQIRISEVEAHHAIQNPNGETNSQPASISVDLHAPIVSSIKIRPEDVNLDSAAIVMPPGPVASESFSSEFKTLQVSHKQMLEDVNTNSAAVVTLPGPVASESFETTPNAASNSEFKTPQVSQKQVPEDVETVSVCLKCGVRGWPETLVFCNKCQVYALHRYCLDGPVIFVKEVTWFCEDCEATAVHLAKDAIQDRIDIIKNFIKRVKKKKQHQQKTGKNQEKKKVLSGPVAKTKVHSSPHHDQPHYTTNCEERNKFMELCQAVPRDEVNSSEESATVQISKVATNDVLNSEELNGHADAEPIADPIWRGTFYFLNKTIDPVGVLVGHLSCLACSRVVEEAKFFREALYADLLERSEVWPKSFQKCGPTHESIALYFFPETESAERDFDKLVKDMIELDLAMRAVFENAELLIFPSILLQIKHRRIQGKYYLWGVFKGKETSPKDK